MLMNYLIKNYNYFQLKNNFTDIRYYKDTSTSVFFKYKKKINFIFYFVKACNPTICVPF